MTRNPARLSLFATVLALAAAPAYGQFTAAPSSLTFGGTSANTQFVFINSTPASVGYTATASVSWLTLTPQVAAITPGSLQVTANLNGVPAGSSGIITISSNSGSPAPITIPVTVSGGGTGTTFSLFPNGPVNLTFQQGGAAPSQAVTVTSSSNLTVTAFASVFSGTAGWLGVTPGAANVGPTANAQFTITTSPAGLPVGPSSGQVQFTAGGQTQTIQVNLTVTGGGTQPLTITPNPIVMSTAAGQTTSATQSVSISTLTPGLAFNINTQILSGSTNWLSASPVAGNTPGTVILTANPAGLATGTYNANLQVTVAGIGTTPVPVTFNVGGGGGGTTGSITAVPRAPYFSPITVNYTVGGATPAPIVFDLNAPANTGFNANTGSASWLQVFPTNGIAPAPTQTLTVSFVPGALAVLTPGQYSQNLTIAPTSGAAATTIPINLVVTGSGGGTGSLSFTPANLTFNIAAGTTAVQTQTFNLNTGTANTFSASAISQTNWLQVEPLSGFTNPNATITARANPAGLPAGTYQGQIRFTVPGQPQQVDYQVTLVVGSGGGTGGPSVSPSSVTFNLPPGGSAPNQTITLTTPQPAAFSVDATATAVIGGQTITWLAFAPLSPQTQVLTPGQLPTANIALGLIGVTNFPVGVYTGNLRVNVSGQTLTVPVTLNVGNAPTGTLSPTPLTFTFQSGVPNPPPQLVTINTLNGTPSSYTATASVTTGPQWLSVSPANGPAPGVLAVSANATGLPPGNFNGTVNVTLGGSAVPITLPVTFIVSTNPVLRVGPTAATFNYTVGGPSQIVQTIPVDVSSTGAALSFTATTQVTIPAGGTWLTVSQPSTTTPSQVTIQVNATGLTAGSYTGVVNFTAPGQPPVAVPVTLNVSSTALINATPQVLTFSSAAGSTAPPPQNLGVSSSGQAFQFTAAASGGSWLSVSPVTTSTTPTNLQVQVNPAGLAEGTYYGSILLTASPQSAAGNSPVIVPVVFSVGGATSISITPGPLTFQQVQGGAPPAAQTLNIASTGQLLTFSVTSTTLSGGSWLQATPGTGITPGQVTVLANAPSLPIGTYNGSVIITAGGASNSPQVVPITLNVIAAPTVTVNPTLLTFNANTAAGNPAAQTVEIRSGGGAVNFNTSATVTGTTVQWLSVSPASGATPGTLTVSVNVAGLAPGTYNGQVAVSTGLVTPILIPVTLNLNQITPAVVTAVTNAASFLPTAVTPGLITAIFGSNLGPTTLVPFRLTPAGTFDTSLSQVRVLFDNIPAPLVYVRNDVVSAIVPYAVAGRASTNVVVENQGVRSQPISVRVQDTAPGIFTTNQQGNGQGAIQNADFSLNGPTNPVARGSFATMYITGEGQTNPPGIDGVIAAANLLRRPTATVQVRVGGQNANIIYAGSVPTVVLGMAQVSFFIPDSAPVGPSVPVEVIIGGVASQGGVTMAVR